MPRLPFLSDNVEKQRRITAEFKGFNTTPARSEGEFSQMMNMSNDLYPNITVRSGRRCELSETGIECIGAKGKLYYVKDGGFYYDNKKKFSVSSGKKRYAHMGNYIIIAPDQMYYDEESGEYGTLYNEYVSNAGEITFGAGYITTSGAAFKGFSKDDGISISGADHEENNRVAIIDTVEDNKITFTTDNIFTTGKNSGAVTIKREVPDMDYICEFGNRLWGCKGNDIYGSAFGDPFNFNKFNGTKAQSYTATLGSHGDFTGMISFMSHLLFFKEECIHKLYGDNPNNYEIVETTCQGTENGADGTIKIVGETVYYKGRKGVYAYTGGMPMLISNALGSESFKSVCAGTDLTKYYITAEKNGELCIYAYNPTYNTWCIEDNNIQVNSFANLGGSLYAAGADGIYMFGDSDRSETEWSFDMVFNETVLERKGYGKLQIRYSSGDVNGFVCVSVQNDDEPMREIRLIQSYEKTMIIPIPIRRSDRLTLRFSGKGAFTLETLVREFYSGSDR